MPKISQKRRKKENRNERLSKITKYKFYVLLLYIKNNELYINDIGIKEI